MHWDDPITENPALDATEIWELHNFTEDAHPIHLHLVQFEVLGRGRSDGDARPPEPGERGTKDTVIALPGEITRVKAHVRPAPAGTCGTATSSSTRTTR